jgi:hypothetical protein
MLVVGILSLYDLFFGVALVGWSDVLPEPEIVVECGGAISLSNVH